MAASPLLFSNDRATASYVWSEELKSTNMSKNPSDYVKAIEGGVQPTQMSETKIYKRRWLVLGIFVLYSASNALQWIQYSIISNIVMKYYGISSLTVDMTSMIYMIMYIPFIFPASYFLDKFLGVAIGFLFPPMLVKSSTDNAIIGGGLQVMFYIVAALTSIILVLILLFFKEQPPLPPSPAQAFQRETESSENFFHSIKRLVTNSGYILLLLSYGINVGIFYAISTLLNRIVLAHFANHEEDAGRIGLTIVCAGMMGSVACGVILDKTHRFKETTLGVYLLSLIGMIIFTFTLDCGKIYVVYITAGMLGFFMTGYLPVGFEFATELTYPEPEGTSAGILNAGTQAFGIAFTMLYGYLFDIWGDFWANIALCITLALGSFLTVVIPNDLRRQRAKV
ncbi:feline leukemia virus subgroup C receptor-related protein 2 isoform X7 [Cephus cinctus]|uniref:Feline leukemia virus subgroup C receptor-related protein 2 isoform X7 n=1 Tax=Cephus cinctus TaxID=211228 RepID=A0AAJ7BRP6_CEPCN|nr:feline leukemia virus subgroup C receptor-related protein 2 isoform X7 [Cephus cinctus]